MPLELDAAERRILMLLQADATMSVADIAAAAGMSQSPCWRRIQRLRSTGVIKAHVALLDRKAAGFDTQIFAQVRLNAQGRENIEEFSNRIRAFPEVLECFVVLGSTDFILRIVTRDIHAYEEFFFNSLSRVKGIQEISSMVTLSEIKSTNVLPLV